MKLSVIVSTVGRSERLFNLARSLAESGREFGDPWEFVVVDNHTEPSATTTQAIEQVSAMPGLTVVPLIERRRGKSCAVNEAVRKARGEILATTDDDCLVAENWLSAIVSEFDRDPDVAAVGGRVELHNARDYPITLRTQRERVICRRGADALNLIIGANVSFRRQAFERLNGFDTAIGPGAYIGSGNDVDILYRAYRAGMKVLYSPDIVVYHDHGRRAPDEIRRLQRGYAIGRGALYAKHALRGDMEMAKMAYWEYRSLVGQALTGLRRRSGWQEPAFFLRAFAKGTLQRIAYDLLLRWR